MTRSTVTVRVPASTSNCGAGFDTLGLALSLYNRVTLTRCEGLAPRAERESDQRAQEMVVETADAFQAATGRTIGGFRFRIEGEVPPARGLGSSITVIGGVLAGLNVLLDAGLSRHQLVELGTKLEGHPDNASAGILGGFCVARCDPHTGAYLGAVRFELPAQLAFVVVSPALEMLTKAARGVLPSSLPYFEAVKAINSATYLVAAFASGDYEKLKHAVFDTMHEPYRLPRIPGGREAIDAGVAAGGLTGWLSGSGSSVLCVSHRPQAGTVVQAMQSAFTAHGVGSEARILYSDNTGLVVEA
ncbi:MAG TPA: homoserine kinase [Opitutaceae bacterium]|jgi:homoserine kinase|nr:homoserine kinase [Opitutaceae bacterium]